MTGRRIVSIWLPQFPMELRSARSGSRPEDDPPAALATDGPHGPVIHAANPAARRAGVAEGARAADMRALSPGLRIAPADPGREAAALDRLAAWHRRWCPWAAADGPRGLILDATGSDHLWGGAAAMLAAMEAALAALGFSARLAAAPSWGAAWALARHAGPRAVCPEGGEAAWLAPLPVAALRLDAETTLLLDRLGLQTIGALARAPRTALARRFAGAPASGHPLRRLDQAMGRLAEPTAAPGPAPDLRAQVLLAEPAMAVAPFLPGLCADLCARLEAAGLGARRLRLVAFRADGETGTAEAAAAAPSRDPAHLARLLQGRLDRIDPGFGFDLILIEAPATEPLAAVQPRLDGAAEPGVALALLIDRLCARFGAEALTCALPRESHLPERAETRASALAAAPALAPDAAPRPDRPIRLLTPPEEIRVTSALPEGPPLQFVWRRRPCRVARCAGPERIAPEWWRDRPGSRLRDYYRVELADGRRFWIYREGLHGDGRGEETRWFLQGIFP